MMVESLDAFVALAAVLGSIVHPFIADSTCVDLPFLREAGFDRVGFVKMRSLLES